jgi:hypothetical protein
MTMLRAVAVMTLIAGTHASVAGAPATCEQAGARWQKVYGAFLLAAIRTGSKPTSEERVWVDERVGRMAKEVTGACRKFKWPESYRRCLADAKQASDLERCFRTEYARGTNAVICDELLVHYRELADVAFTDLYKDHDKIWIDGFREQHVETMRPWCIERGLVTPAGSACARKATSRDEFLACGGVD